MHLTRMKIGAGSHPAFQQDIELKLNERVNLFIGANASGKTSLLRVIAEAGGLENATIFSFILPEVQVSDDWPQVTENADSSHSNFGANFASRPQGRSLTDLPWVYLPATRIELPGEFDEHIFQFNSNHIANELDSGWPDIDWPDNSQVFDNRCVEFIAKVLFESFKHGEPRFSRLRGLLRHSAHCAASISELITGRLTNYVTHPYDVLSPEEIDPLAVEPYVHPGMGVVTSTGPDKKALAQYAGNLSSGTQGAFLWVLYVALKIAYYYQLEKGWHEKPAILLIDEIENHLHPTWQRRVIPALLDHFPRLQIFATTHSPFVVAGLKAGQVHVLKRDENGVVTAATEPRDVIGWTADEILRGMMGVDEPTDQLTVDRAERLRELRGKAEINDQEEEELNRLRRQVNEDLLNKRGPLEAQRERYADLMEEFLRSRQSELNQDGE